MAESVYGFHPPKPADGVYQRQIMVQTINEQLSNGQQILI